MKTQPLFIVGPSRSGTTLLSQILDNHPDIAILPETWMFTILERFGCTKRFNNKWSYILFMNELWEYVSRFDSIAAKVVAEIALEYPDYTGLSNYILEKFGSKYSKRRGAIIWGEKTPAHLLRLNLLDWHFSSAKYLRIARDPRDILVSYADAWNNSSYDYAFIKKVAPLVKSYMSNLVDRNFWDYRHNLLVRYEDLVNNIDLVTRNICDFLDISFSEQMKYHYQSNRSGKLANTKLHSNLKKPISPSRIGRYINSFSNEQIAFIEHIFKEEMLELGYHPSRPIENLNHQLSSIQRIKEKSKRISSGTEIIRYKQILRGRIKVLACIFIGGNAANLWSGNIAITNNDWMQKSLG